MATEPSPGTGTTEGAPAPTPRRSDRHDAPVAPPSQRRRAAKRLLGAIVLIVAFVLLVAVPAFNFTTNLLAQLGSKPATSANAPSGGEVVPASSTYKGSTWPMVKGNYDNNRWFGDGISAIKNAKSREDAEKAASIWTDKVKRDPILLAGAAGYILKQNVDPASLVDKQGWATTDAVILATKIEMAVADSKISPDTAPSTSTNSGVDLEKVVAAIRAGLAGDRRAIKIELPDGTTIWILGRCGNIATKGAPPKHIKRGATDCGPADFGQGNPENRDLNGDGVGDGRIAQDVGGHKSSDTKTGAARGELEDIADEQKDSSGGDQGTEYGSDNKEDPVTGPGADEGEGDSNNDRSVETTGWN